MCVEAAGNDDVAQTNFNFEREKTVFRGCSLLAAGVSQFYGTSLKKKSLLEFEETFGNHWKNV